MEFAYRFMIIYTIAIICFFIFGRLFLWFIDNSDSVIDFFGLGKQADKLEKKLAKKFIKENQLKVWRRE